ncbi:hypothetical protein DDE82_005077 [Stemphylium lycopersici]|nr:hypothetical protein DDE82_005077 [Stemphylium lycopersici]
MGANASKNGDIPGTYPSETDRESDEKHGSDRSCTSSMIVESGGFNEDVDQPRQPRPTRNVASPLFQPGPHPYAKRSLDAGAIGELWHKIEMKQASSEPFALMQVLSALEVLRHASISKQALQESDIIARLRGLQNVQDRDIAKNASEVVMRLQNILFQWTPTNEPVQPWPPAHSIFFSYRPPPPSNVFQTPAPISISNPMTSSPSGPETRNITRNIFAPKPETEKVKTTPQKPVQAGNENTASEKATPSILKTGPAVSKPGGLFAGLSGQKNVKPRQPWILPSTIRVMKDEKRPLRAESDPASFNFNIPPSATNPQPLFSGSFGQNKENPFIDPLSVGPKDPPPNPFVRSQASNNSPWPRTSSPGNPSPFKFGETKSEPMATREEFITWVKTFLDLDQPDMATVTFHLRSLWGSITSFSYSLRRTGQSIAEGRNSIRNMESEIAQIQTVQSTYHVLANPRRDLLTRCQDRLSLARESLREQEKIGRELREDLAKAVCLPLQKMASVGKAKQYDYEKRITEARSEARFNLVEAVEVIEKMRKELAVAQDQISIIESEKAEAKSQVIAGYFEIRDLSVTIGNLHNDLESKNAKHVEEKKTLTDQYRARAEIDAAAKSAQCAKAMAKVEELERQIEVLEREKMDITCAKATVEKEREDFEAEVNKLKGYKDGYSQLVRELDELQGTYNDAVAERDDLMKQMQDAAASAKAPSRHELGAAQSPFASHHQSDNARATKSDHLDGLIDHWQHQFKIKMVAIGKAQADIASLEAEICEVHGLLFPVRKRMTPPVETTANTANKTEPIS